MKIKCHHLLPKTGVVQNQMHCMSLEQHVIRRSNATSFHLTLIVNETSQ